MQHRGEIVEHAIRTSGYSISKLATKLGKSRRWMYLMFENPKVSLDDILQIGKLINHDFSNEINEFKNIPDWNSLEPHGTYRREENMEYWKAKYYELLEEYHQLLKNIKI